MSVVRGFGLNGKSIYTNVVTPRNVWCKFTVGSTNSAGLGITSLKSNGYVESVFMNTNQTPGVVNGITNPNPVAGYALVTFKNAFNHYLGGFSGQVQPTTSNTTSSLTTGHAYVITVLGTTTTANWQAVGLQAGITPAVGVGFIATATASITGTGKVGLPAAPVAPVVSVVGDPDASITNSNIGSNSGARILVQFSQPIVTMGAYTPAGTNSAPALTMDSYTPAGIITNGTPDTFAGTPATLTGTVAAPTFTGSAASLTGAVTYAVTAPTNGTIVSMQFCFDGSSVTIDGL